jgi:hypothetical protein
MIFYNVLKMKLLGELMQLYTTYLLDRNLYLHTMFMIQIYFIRSFYFKFVLI